MNFNRKFSVQSMQCLGNSAAFPNDHEFPLLPVSSFTIDQSCPQSFHVYNTESNLCSSYSDILKKAHQNGGKSLSNFKQQSAHAVKNVKDRYCKKNEIDKNCNYSKKSKNMCLSINASENVCGDKINATSTKCHHNYKEQNIPYKNKNFHKIKNYTQFIIPSPKHNEHKSFHIVENKNLNVAPFQDSSLPSSSVIDYNLHQKLRSITCEDNDIPFRANIDSFQMHEVQAWNCKKSYDNNHYFRNRSSIFKNLEKRSYQNTVQKVNFNQSNEVITKTHILVDPSSFLEREKISETKYTNDQLCQSLTNQSQQDFSSSYECNMKSMEMDCSKLSSTKYNQIPISNRKNKRNYLSESSAKQKNNMNHFKSIKESQKKAPLNSSNCTTKPTIKEVSGTRTARRKQRPSQVKRQTAFQTGKLFILSSEVHSRIASQLSDFKGNEPKKNIFCDINNSSEYPELHALRSFNMNAKSKNSKLFHESKGYCDARLKSEDGQAKMYIEKEKIGNFQSIPEKKSSYKKEIDRIDKEGIFGSGSVELGAYAKPPPLQLAHFVDILDSPKVEIGPRKEDHEISTAAVFCEKNKLDVMMRGPNALDSSAPIKKRGKEREKPKSKKRSPMKKIILQERAQKISRMKTFKRCGTANKEIKNDQNFVEEIEECCSVMMNKLCMEDRKSFKNDDISMDDLLADLSSFSFLEFEAYNRETADSSSFRIDVKNVDKSTDTHTEIIGYASENDYLTLLGKGSLEVSECQSLAGSHYMFNCNHSDEIYAMNYNEVCLDACNIDLACIKCQNIPEQKYSDEIGRTADEIVNNCLYQALKVIESKMQNPVENLLEESSVFPSSDDVTLADKSVSISDGFFMKDIVTDKNSDFVNDYSMIKSACEEGNQNTSYVDNFYDVSLMESVSKNNIFKNKKIQSSKFDITENSNSDESFQISNCCGHRMSSDKDGKFSDILKQNKNFADERDIDLSSYKTGCNVSTAIINSLAVTNNPVKEDEARQKAVEIALHAQNFREYCSHFLSKDLNECVISLVSTLHRFQDRLYKKDPMKVHGKRRLIYGIKEVTKHLKLKKIKCVIVAPNLENIKSKGGLNDALEILIHHTEEYHAPCIFASDRKTLGKITFKPVPVSCIGVFNYEGAEVHFKKMMELYESSKRDYRAVYHLLKHTLKDADINDLIKDEESSFETLLPVRTKVMKNAFNQVEAAKINLSCDNFVDFTMKYNLGL